MFGLDFDMFETYLKLGYKHILDINGFDHVLFVIALCAIYSFRDGKKILVLVTAFTIGHSVTLALSALKVVTVSADLIEFLIPLTILATAIYNVLARHEHSRSLGWSYLLALGFGLIHGLGFSNFFKALMGPDESILGPLFSFNIGVELGQIVIVAAIFLVNYIVTELLGAKQREWMIFLSGAAAGVAITLMIG